MSSAWVVPADHAHRAAPAGSDLAETAGRNADQALTHIVDLLLQWYSDPQALQSDDIEPPTPEAITRALKLLPAIRDWLVENMKQDTIFVVRGASIGTGGSITIECAHRNVAIVFAIEADATAEFRVFDDNRLVRRGALPQELRR